jgi:hypothetical protein
VLLSLWPNYWDDWELEHKVTFDGENKLIYVEPQITNIDIESELYSAWKEWVLLRYNSQFEQCFRNVGGDPLPGGDFLGATFFLLNGWRIVLDHGVDFVGNLYTQEGASPFNPVQGQQVSTSTVSNIVSKITAPDLSLVNVDNLTLEQALKAILAVVAGKTNVTIDGVSPGTDKVEFFGRDGSTIYVSGSVENGVRTGAAVIDENL